MRGKGSDQVKKTYEQRPYPHEAVGLRSAKWRLAATDWIKVVWNHQSDPERILVAGCGTGTEAFALQWKFPEAEITAVDFSPRSITIAQDLQRRSRGARRIRFLIADLAGRDLNRIIGRDFDFVTCHGVLSYFAEPSRVLRNLAGALANDGALYLGVNGADHFSVRLREALPSFGIDVTELNDLSFTREVLRICDAFQGRRGANRSATFSENLLAGDLFGPMILNLSLANWIGIARDAGLHFQSSFMTYMKIRHILENDAFLLLWPRTHSDVIQLVELLSPAPFHKLIFTRKKLIQPPWNQRKKLGVWRPSFTSLYTGILPKPSASETSLRKVTLKSTAVETQIQLNLRESEVAILRRCNGKKTIDEILAKVPVSDSQSIIRRLFYSLYQLLILRMDLQAAENDLSKGIR